MASLFVVRGRDQGKHFPLSGDVVRIGRDKSSTIQLLDTEASRSHAEIHIDPGGRCELVDLESSNGTLVNGLKVRRQRLASGDRLEIGGSLLIFTSTGPPNAMDAAHGVDIVYQSHQTDGSRIVSSIAPSSGTLRIGPSHNIAPTQTDADRSLEVMYRTAIAVGRTDDLDQLLNRILWLVFDWVEADRGCVMLRDNETGQFQPAARCDRDSENESDGSRGENGSSQRISISRTILDFVLEQKEGVRTSDASDDVRFDSAASIVSAGVREAICVPLQGRYDIVGALYVDTYTAPTQMIARDYAPRFTDDHLRLITAIGHQAALAIEDTFYYSALVQGERLAAMGQTIATLSHHIKNILQGIRGGSYLIEAGLQRDDTDAVRRGWRIVDRNQERISNLVLDMLTFSKERTPQCVDADLNETVRDVFELMQPRAAELDVTLTASLAESMPDASFDPDAFHRAVLNLVTNAIDATSEQVKLRLSEESEGDSEQGATDAVARVEISTCYDAADGWTVDVVDNGPGVAEQDRQKIFSLFESRKGSRGTGLGLPVSAKIMQEHGGEIQVLTPASGIGSCFRLRLPTAGSDTGEIASHETLH
ncbi:ATP-binding protein [Novipirellula artificiosorum]|uniref:histidine kinase n=1 Tax=Novipirellula artificiosorum TaxID=2528016 RepID=A0A5C6D5J6_9BACT|nr:ATP-binding protein [Novipirellula artificiosorum]TWU30991.1 Sensor protein ZraS [Novipirellula artificiosorum]